MKYTDTNSMIETAKTLDCFLVLTGESKKERNRSDLAIKLYNNIERDDLNMVLSGRGRTLGQNEKTQSEQMKEYLISFGIPEEILWTENKARDTLGNMIYSKEILEQILSGYVSKKIGLITEEFHMDRSLWIADYVFGSKYDFAPLPAEKKVSLSTKIKESLLKNALEFDLKSQRIKSGDIEMLKKYLEEENRFYNEKAPLNAYNICVFLNSARIKIK